MVILQMKIHVVQNVALIEFQIGYCA